MSESDSTSDESAGRAKVEVWMPAPLKNELKSRAEDENTSMAAHLRALVRADVDAHAGARDGAHNEESVAIGGGAN